MQHHQQDHPPSASSTKRSILDTPDHQLAPQHHSRDLPSSPLQIKPIDTSTFSPRQQADLDQQSPYHYHQSQRLSIDSNVPSPEDLAREYLHSPESQHSSPLSDPSPIITTPVSLKSPFDQGTDTFSKDVDQHLIDRPDQHDQPRSGRELSIDSHRFPTQANLKGLGIYPFHHDLEPRPSANSGATASYRDHAHSLSPLTKSPTGQFPAVIHNNRSVAFHIHFPASPTTTDRSGARLSSNLSHEVSSPNRNAEDTQAPAMATLATPDGRSTPRPMSANSTRRAPPPPLAPEGSYVYATSDASYGLAPAGQHQGESMAKPVQLRASADPFVGGAGYIGMTPTPSRHTFESAGIQMPEIQTQPDQLEQNQSLPALKTIVQDESVFGPLPVMENGSAPLQVYESANGTPIGEGFPSARSYRRSFTSQSAGAATHSSRKSSMSFHETGQPHPRAPSYHVQHVVSPTQSAPTYWTYGPSYVAVTPRSSEMSHQGLIPIANPNEGHGGQVSLPGFNQLYVETNVPNGRSASAGHQMSMQQQQHLHMQRQGHSQSYQVPPQQRLQPMQTRHLPFPQTAGMQHYSSNGLQPPVHFYSHPPGTALIGWDANGNPEYSYTGPATGVPVYVQQGMPVQEFITYPPHAFQNGAAMAPPGQDGEEPPTEGEVDPGHAQPHGAHHNVFAYQYAPGEDMDMDAPTPSVHGAHIDEAEQAEEIGETEKLDDPLSEPESEPQLPSVDSAEEEWIPQSFKKKKKAATPKGASKRKKGKGGKSSAKTSPARKTSRKHVISSPTVQTPLDKSNKVIIKLPPLMPIENNLVRFTSMAEEKQTDTLKRECFTCGCRDPPSWRKSTLAPKRILCNRCGIYERSHKRTRPIGEVEMRSASLAATVAKKSKSKGKASSKMVTESLNTIAASQLRASFIAHTPAGYTSGGHAMYPSYGQENDATRVSSVSGLPPGITDPAGYSTKTSRKKSRATSTKGALSRNKSGPGGYKTFTSSATYTGVPRMEPYQYALAAHRSDLTSSVPLEKANGSGRPTNLQRSASAMPAGNNLAPWGNPYGDDEEEDE